jgi:endonuclease YncB( thermonuclease family)
VSWSQLSAIGQLGRFGLWLTTVALWTITSTAAQAAQVLSIGDGDTLTVVEGSRRITVRLACVDAPETVQVPYGSAARTALQQLVPVGSTVELRVGDTDRYGRTVAEVWRGSTNTNLRLVASGHAFVYRTYLKAPCSPSTYLKAEEKAQAARLGVWSVQGGIARPWDFRQGRKSTKTVNSSGGASSGRYTCRSIGSWAKAQELLRQGHGYLDRDGDGEACESLK